MVKEVKHIHPDLEIQVFLDLDNLRQRGIPVAVTRTTQRIPMQAAIPPILRTSKGSRIEPMALGLPGIRITNQVREQTSGIDSLQVAIGTNVYRTTGLVVGDPTDLPPVQQRAAHRII